jgi:hypothetical protein
MRSLWRNHGLSLTLGVLFAVTLWGQSVAGMRSYNHERETHGEPAIGYMAYLRSADFLESMAENWESEFLQMAAYVILTVFLFQRGSAESKNPDAKAEAVDREPDRTRPDSPWPVRRGGIALAIYRNSLSLALVVLFLMSLVLHAVGGARRYNEDLMAHRPSDHVTALEYLTTARFWFESLQNWQSEFLSVLAIVVLTIFLRQHGSPESKPVDAPHTHTGGA